MMLVPELMKANPERVGHQNSGSAFAIIPDQMISGRQHRHASADFPPKGATEQ
ncbi:MAG: hypothetical protein K2R93_01240 [Gemmatimonadaceae bacterium]|nr:hypothetical protein [Gemmatimonadaceae bacterium]